MTLEQLRIFVAVAEREHVTRAAEVLNLTQSSVSAAIAALEQRHGVALFDRVGRTIRLNQAGNIFLAEARAVLAQAEIAETALADLAGLGRGRVTVMASQTVGCYWLPPRLATFRTAHPGITVGLEIGNTAEVAAAVATSAVEIGLVEGEVESAEIDARIVAEDEMILVVPPNHPWAVTAPATAADFTAVPWLLREPGSGTRAAREKLFRDLGIADADIIIAATLPANEAIVSGVAAGLGAALISRSVAAAHLRAGLIAAVAYPSLSRPFRLLTLRQRHRGLAAAALAALLARAD